jgi:hypothetical protein
MITRIKNAVRNNYVNMRGWSTERALLLIESDDWGSIKMPSKEVFDILKTSGVAVDSSYFTKYDCLENEKDLTDLFEVLNSFNDINGNPLCITANTIMANPDFEKIESNGFSKYEYELFTETYKRYGDYKVFPIWKEGVDMHILFPQFHGREHFNPLEWMNVLKNGNRNEILAFENKVLLGLDNTQSSKRYLNYTSAFNYESLEERDSFREIIHEGTNHFRSIFGFESKSFVPPCGIKGYDLDKILFENGINYLQSGRLFEPDGRGGVIAKNHFWGDKNEHGQLYWRRNSTFEPSRDWNYDWEGSIMKEAEYAFRWGKPLVINSHRVNYVGGIDPRNRENTLRLLARIVKKLQAKYSNLEFISSDQLGDLIKSTSK